MHDTRLRSSLLYFSCYVQAFLASMRNARTGLEIHSTHTHNNYCNNSIKDSLSVILPLSICSVLVGLPE